MKDWYLVRTKTGGERTAQGQLQQVVDRTLLPLGKSPIRQLDRVFYRITPIFPSYIFVYCCLGSSARQIRYTPGVREVVRFGEQAATVPSWVIDELIARCAGGAIDLSTAGFSHGAHVKVIGGPFRDLDAAFDGYLSGTERVSVLLSIMNAERRVVMPANMLVAAE